MRSMQYDPVFMKRQRENRLTEAVTGEEPFGVTQMLLKQSFDPKNPPVCVRKPWEPQYKPPPMVATRPGEKPKNPHDPDINCTVWGFTSLDFAILTPNPKPHNILTTIIYHH
jgi:hypothetical protein